MQPPVPLDAEEKVRLRRWQKRMIVLFTAFWVVAALMYLIHFTVGIPPAAETPLAIFALLFVVAAAVVQFGEKCPRCGKRIGLQSRLLLPKHCTRCKVAFK